VQRKLHTAKTILTALPYIKRFTKKTIVIKYGGAAQINPDLKDRFAQDLVLLYLVGIKPVIIHGGGKRINTFLDKLHLGTEFKDGMRITDEKVMEVVEMVLSGSINKEITTLLNHHGAKAIGISGKDANFIKAKPLDDGKYGLVGDISEINETVLENIINQNFIPVVAPIASGQTLTHPGYNINADWAASKIAVSLKAEKILFLTDTPGVLDKEGKLLSSLNTDEVEALKKDGTIHGGMLPKVNACLEAVANGVKQAHIIDGRIEHSILLELFTDEGVGTVFSQ
jgi:acetylglutamate kinase